MQNTNMICFVLRLFAFGVQRYTFSVTICSHCRKNAVIWRLYLSGRFIAVCYT